jgi:prevent-host-death family protein
MGQQFRHVSTEASSKNELASTTDHYTDHMTRKVTATEAKAKILGLLDDVAAGEEIEITKHGHTVARLVAASGPNALKGQLSGVAMTAGDEKDLFTTGASWDLS